MWRESNEKPFGSRNIRGVAYGTSFWGSELVGTSTMAVGLIYIRIIKAFPDRYDDDSDMLQEKSRPSLWQADYCMPTQSPCYAVLPIELVPLCGQRLVESKGTIQLLTSRPGPRSQADLDDNCAEGP